MQVSKIIVNYTYLTIYLLQYIDIWPSLFAAHFCSLKCVSNSICCQRGGQTKKKRFHPCQLHFQWTNIVWACHVCFAALPPMTNFLRFGKLFCCKWYLLICGNCTTNCCRCHMGYGTLKAIDVAIAVGICLHLADCDCESNNEWVLVVVAPVLVM